jgi:hypothetical protein
VTLIAGLDSGINPAKRHGVLPETVIDTSPRAVHYGGTGLCHQRRGPGLRARDRTGRLRAGLDADLLAVDGDLLTDITALRDVRLVISRGRDVPLAA